ncbi:ESAT-6-like protein [Mycolicibacterium arabiense]|uniref:ESAT-6-like protein n=1 Tax=Mycolicibacterium arabiense TaxID=1286181 RepID=A0A7I7RYA8_9MYCO|nr:WXG100 family type VII secretion target [Mycolicibacterium arabiense]MCV7373684.1 WXG100 family type VII secretion target [Mycolicibacterium arabiense]BBY48929.1 ESAT-6-like protein [Mycolicibacterium arabiense]
MLVVDFAQMQAAIDHMAKFGQEVTEVLDDVDAAMAALRSTWHGEASDQQAQAQQQWDEGAEQMKAALEQLKAIAEAARKNYSDAVNKNGQMWG